MEEARYNPGHSPRRAEARDHSKDQHDLEMPMQEIENFTRHLRSPNDCDP